MRVTHAADPNRQQYGIMTGDIRDAWSMMESKQEPWTCLAHNKQLSGWVMYNPRTMRPQPLGEDNEHMKIISYSVNGLRNLAPLGQSCALTQRKNFDVLRLYETFEGKFCCFPQYTISLHHFLSSFHWSWVLIKILFRPVTANEEHIQQQRNSPIRRYTSYHFVFLSLC